MGHLVAPPGAPPALATSLIHGRGPPRLLHRWSQVSSTSKARKEHHTDHWRVMAAQPTWQTSPSTHTHSWHVGQASIRRREVPPIIGGPAGATPMPPNAPLSPHRHCMPPWKEAHAQMLSTLDYMMVWSNGGGWRAHGSMTWQWSSPYSTLGYK